MISIPSISAESIDDNSISEGVSGETNPDLNIRDLDSVSSSDIFNDLEEDSNANQNYESSNELINRIYDANNGDTIVIEPGTYKIHGVNITKNISLQGNGNPREVIIDGEKLSSIFLIQNKDLTVTFNNLTFINGQSDNFGGAICMETGNVYVDNCIFINNTALNVTNGGAISNYGNETDRSYLFVNNSLFIGNHADHDGGAVTTCYAISDIYNSVFINNSARRDGGAVRVSIFGYGSVQDCIFMYNHADEWAGAYYSWAGNSSIDRCIFINNTAGTNGGAVMVSGSLNLTNSIIVNNTASETGGSFYIQQPMFDAKTIINVKNNIITNNSSPLGQEIFLKWNATNLLFPMFNGNDWGDEDPRDSSVVDPNNVSRRIRPSSNAHNLGLFDLLDFSLLGRYSDVLNDYYSRDYKDHFGRFSDDSNDDGLKFDNNKSDSDDSNGKINSGINDANSNNSSNNLLNDFENNLFNNKSSAFKGEKSDNFNSTYVNENSNNRKMTELFEDNPTSQKSFDIKHILALSIVLLLFLFGLLRKRDRSS
ncbi:MAG: hypothetical protein IJH35_05150 [Methanobrevibacter sp.]|nr:hypothetical protein [Methanobrevibacter sp.]